MKTAASKGIRAALKQIEKTIAIIEDARGEALPGERQAMSVMLDRLCSAKHEAMRALQPTGETRSQAQLDHERMMSA
jgi:hypothetical protein